MNVKLDTGKEIIVSEEDLFEAVYVQNAKRVKEARDAALEEAAQLIEDCWCALDPRVAMDIRALKSKDGTP